MTDDAYSLQRDVGRLQGEMAAVKHDLSDIREDLTQIRAEQRKEFKAINETLNQARGSWRAMLAVSGMAATLGALAVKIVPWLHSFPK